MKKSFSIIELLIVMTAVIFLFTLTIPRVSVMNRFVLQNEIDKLLTTFSFLQQRAVASNKLQDIVFNLNDNSYSYNLRNDKRFVHKLPRIIKFGFLPNVLGPPAKPKKKIVDPVSFKKINEKEYQVLFFTDGRVYPGTIYLVDIDQKNMMALTCPVSQISYIRKYRYDSGRWACLN